MFAGEEIKMMISGLFFWNGEKKLSNYTLGANSDVSNVRPGLWIGVCNVDTDL